MISLVTGATGFLGSHLVDELLLAGEHVRILVRPESLRKASRRPNLDIVEGRLEDASSVKRAVEGVSRIYHCAAHVADHGAWDTFYQTNIVGTQHVLDACKTSSISCMVHVSTSDVYGYPNACVSEDAPYRKRGYGYGDSKIEAEKRVWQAHRQHGVPVVVFRPSSIYGPRCIPFVAEIAQALENGVMFHVGHAKHVAGLTYVTNVTDALRLAAENKDAIGQVYNIHDGAETSWEEYTNRLAHQLGVKPPRIRLPFGMAYHLGQAMELAWDRLRLPGRPLISRVAVELLGTNQRFDTTHLRNHLAWTPRIAIEEGIARSAAWWKQERSRAK